MSESLSEDEFMRLQDNPAVQRRDYFFVDPRVLKVDANYNVREMDSPETVAHIEALKATIADSGVRTPLQVRLVGDDIFIVSGHCRHAAVMALIAEGRDDLKAVPAVPEPQGTSEVERTLNLHLSNANNPLSTLAKAKIVKRLLDFGWTEDNIARRMGWKSRASVTQALEIVALSEPMQQRVRKGEVSATTARNLAKSDLTQEEQDALIAANLEENKRIKGTKKRSTKVTKKTLKRDAKPPAQPQDQEPSHVEPQSLPATGAITSGTPTEASVVATPPQPLSGIPENRVEPDAVDRERDQGVRPTDTLIRETQAKVQEFHRWTPDDGHAPSSASIHPALREFKALMEAFATVLNSINETDLNEIGDEDRVHYNLSGKDAKRLSLLYARATGGEEIAA